MRISDWSSDVCSSDLKHPDLFSGEAIVPAFRTDKESLADLIASNEGLSEAGITDRRLDDHIARLDSSIVSAMPWALADVGEKFRTLLLAGLRQGNSHVVAMLRAAGLSGEDVEKVAEEVAALDHSNSVTLRSYIGRSDEHTSELQSLMRIQYAFFS